MSQSNDPMEIFPKLASSVLSGVPHELRFEEAGPRWRVDVPAPNASGFGVVLVCETYGLVPSAEGWWGAWWGAMWDFGPWPTEDVCLKALEFTRVLASPQARIRIQESAGRPYRWILELRKGEQWVPEDQTIGSPFFNYFGKRTERVIQQGEEE